MAVGQTHIWRTSTDGTLGEIPAVMTWVEQVARGAGLQEDTAYGLQVCVEELLTNVARHAAPAWAGEPGKAGRPEDRRLSVLISLEALPERILLTIEDNGPAFDVSQAPASAIRKPLEEVKPGGLGIHLIRTFAESLEYSRAGLGNRVVLGFSRGAGAASGS